MKSEKSRDYWIYLDGSQKIIGKGMLPVLKSTGDGDVFCVWENDKQIEGYILHL